MTLLIQNITIHSIKWVKNLDYEQENDYEQEKNKKLKYSTKYNDPKGFSLANCHKRVLNSQ